MADPFADGSIPDIGLGVYLNFRPDQCRSSVENGIDIGYRHIDTAQFYTNERWVGEAINNVSVDRDELFVATKVWQDHLYHDGVIDSTIASLAQLDVDTVDLLYVHWPAESYEPVETLGAFNQLVDEGKVDHIGVSNFTLDQWKEAVEVSDAPILANQVEMHVLLQQDELVEYAQDNGLYVVAYAPLGQKRILDDPLLEDVAEKYGATTAQVALAYLIQKDNVIAIPKATGRAHLEENFAALDLDLEDEDVDRIDNIGREERFIVPCFGPWEEAG